MAVALLDHSQLPQHSWPPSRDSTARSTRTGELRWEEFLYKLKAGPAGGRLRRPSSAGNDTMRTGEPAPTRPTPSRAQVGRRIANRRTLLLVADFTQRH